MLSSKLKSLTEHSLIIVIILSIGLFVGSVVVGLFIQNNPLIKSFDAFGYQLITKGPHSNFLDYLVYPINVNFLPFGAMPSYYYPMILLFLIYMLSFKRSLFLWALFCIVAGTFFAGLVTALDWHFVYRVRPFETLPNNVDPFFKSAWKPWSSYPSGHTRETTLYATIFASFIPQLKWVMIIFCLFVGWSRVYVGAHFPTDVIAGLAIGYLSAKVTLIVARELQLIWQGRRELLSGTKPKATRQS